MSDGATLVVGLLGLIAAMIFVILRQQRRKEARLAALAEIEIHLELHLGQERWHVDLDQPCELTEASAFV